MCVIVLQRRGTAYVRYLIDNLDWGAVYPLVAAVVSGGEAHATCYFSTFSRKYFGTKATLWTG